ncbi:hypothetical protein FHD46_21830 [Escherichia coli]|nr:hypothetical protein [Escherichia coli]
MNIERINTNGFDGSDDLISEIEVVIGKKLPDDYKLLLIKNNGGHPELDSFFFHTILVMVLIIFILLIIVNMKPF